MKVKCPVCSRQVDVEKNLVVTHKNYRERICYGSYMPVPKSEKILKINDELLDGWKSWNSDDPT